MILNKIKRLFLGMYGTVLLMISIFLILFPIMPVRPLLKLVKLCYFNSSEKLYGWFVNHPIFGAILDKTRGLTKGQFLYRVVFVFIIYFGIMFFSLNVLVRILATAGFICSIVYYYYRTLK